MSVCFRIFNTFPQAHIRAHVRQISGEKLSPEFSDVQSTCNSCWHQLELLGISETPALVYRLPQAYSFFNEQLAFWYTLVW